MKQAKENPVLALYSFNFDINITKISMFSCQITTWKTVRPCFLVSNYVSENILLKTAKQELGGQRTLFLLWTYNDGNEVQQEHPKYTLLTNNIHRKML